MKVSKVFFTTRVVPVSQLYSQMLSTTAEIKDYNFREYFARRISVQ